MSFSNWLKINKTKNVDCNKGLDRLYHNGIRLKQEAQKAFGKKLENKEIFDKVLFLDIDGVLNSSKFFDSLNDEDASWKEIDEEAVKMLQRIKEETDCKVVMTSSWRNG